MICRDIKRTLCIVQRYKFYIAHLIYKVLFYQNLLFHMPFCNLFLKQTPLFRWPVWFWLFVFQDTYLDIEYCSILSSPNEINYINVLNQKTIYFKITIFWNLESSRNMMCCDTDLKVITMLIWKKCYIIIIICMPV